eukprot:158449-Rhodomonas_salina.1
MQTLLVAPYAMSVPVIHTASTGTHVGDTRCQYRRAHRAIGQPLYLGSITAPKSLSTWGWSSIANISTWEQHTRRQYRRYDSFVPACPRSVPDI